MPMYEKLCNREWSVRRLALCREICGQQGALFVSHQSPCMEEANYGQVCTSSFVVVCGQRGRAQDLPDFPHPEELLQ